MAIEDREWYREHMRAKRQQPAAAAPQRPPARRKPITRFLPPLIVGAVLYGLVRMIL